MSPSRPKTSSLLAMTREKAVAGQTLCPCGMLRSRISVGNNRVKPETKNSVSNCDMVILKKKATSFQTDGNAGGRSLPKRSMRTSNDSSTADSTGVSLPVRGPDLSVEMSMSLGVVLLRVRLLDSTGDI